MSLNAAKRGDVQITLTSPSNTTSTLIAKRPKDYSRNGFNDWPFLTVHMWEESPYGTWYLQVINDGLSYVRLEDFSLSIIGTEVHPQTGLKSSNSKEPSKPAEKPVQPAPGVFSTKALSEILLDSFPVQRTVHVARARRKYRKRALLNTSDSLSGCEQPPDSGIPHPRPSSGSCCSARSEITGTANSARFRTTGEQS